MSKPMPASKQRGIHYAWIMLFGLFIFRGLTNGAMNNSLGLYILPISNELDLKTGALYIMFSTAAIVTVLWSPVAGKLVAKLDIRLVIAFGVLFQGGFYALLGLASSLPLFYTFAGLMALGAIINTQLLGAMIVTNWFAEKRGMAMGLMMAISGLVGAIALPVVGNVITSSGWRMGYFSLGITTIVVCLPIGLILFRKKPEDKGMTAYGAEIAEAKAAAAKEENAETETTEESDPNAAPVIPGITSNVAIKTPAFWFSFFYLFFLVCVSSISTQMSGLSAEAGHENIAGSAMGLFLLGSTFGAFGLGTLVDKFGAKLSTYLALGSGVIGIVLLLFMRTNSAVFLVSFFVLGVMASGIATLAPLIVADIFGYKEFSGIFGYLLMSMSLASTIITPVYGTIYDKTQSYQGVLLLMGVFLVAATAAITFAMTSAPKMRAKW